MASSTSSSALKLAAACMLLLCVASDLTRPAMASSSSSSPCPDQDQETAAARALMREHVDHDLAEHLGLQGNVGDICSQACQTCLIVCAVTCVVVKDPIACFSNCTVSTSCFGKPVATSPIR